MSAATAGGADLAASAHDAGLAAAGPHDLAPFPELVRRIDLAVLRGIAACIQGTAGTGPWTADGLADAFAAAERHRWILGHWLAALVSEGLAVEDGSAVRLASRIRRSELVAVRRDLHEARAGLGYPAELTDYLLRTLHELPRLLRDEVSSQALLFPGAEPATAEAVYRDNPLNRYLNAAAAEAVRHCVPSSPTGLRVLELGAGIGATTADLLPVLEDRTAEYLFTDVSTFFLRAAQERFTQPFLRFGLLDFATGLPDLEGPFDLVVAANTAHNAPHVPLLLEQVNGLLSPGGRLLLIETCREHHQSLTSMPFLLSGRAPRRDLRAGTERTYLTRDEWRRSLDEAGFRTLVDLPPAAQPLSALSQRLMFASP